MGNTKSVIKRARQSERRRATNRANSSKCKTAIKKLETLIEQKDAQKARELLPGVVRIIVKAVFKKNLSKNSASRKISSLTLRVNALV